MSDILSAVAAAQLEYRRRRTDPMPPGRLGLWRLVVAPALVLIVYLVLEIAGRFSG